MGLCCDLEVDVNGEGVFVVDKELICSFSGKLCKLFGKTSATNHKVIFHDFPGGAEMFELVARFCYNNGSIKLSPANVISLHFAATFMEMYKVVSGTKNLAEQTEKMLEKISSWTCSDLLYALKQRQDVLLDVNTSGVVQKCLDTLIGRLAVTADTSSCPSISSPDSSGFRISCDSRSTESIKTSCSRATWWFDDLSAFDEILFDKAVNSMVFQKFDHSTVHTDLSEEETFKICSALNYEKLSQEACVHLSKNKKFPSRSAVQALLSQQTKLKSLLHDASYPPPCSSSPSSFSEFGKRLGPSDQIGLYAGQTDVTSENEKLRKHLQGMQWRVTELEKVCQKMQGQMAKMTKPKSSSNMSPKSLPKLCS